MGIKQFIKLTALPLALTATSVNASSISFDLDQSNVLPNGTDYLTVTISDSLAVSGDIDFSVVVNSANFTPGSNFGMDNFYFNYDNSLSVGSANIIDIDPSSWTIKTDKNAGGGFGFFEFDLKGSGSSRTELLSFSISGVTGDTINSYAVGYEGLGDAYFAAHVGGFVDAASGESSAKFASIAVVPVPAAAWLFGTGLLGLVAVARRKD